MLCKRDGTAKAIMINLSGHGYFDMQAYTDFFAGALNDAEYSQDELAMALAGLPSVT